MSRGRPRALAILVVALSAMPAAVGAQPLPPDLAAAVRAYDAAQANGDRAGLERLLADDYLLINSQGVPEDKATLIAEYTAPGFALDPFTVEQPIAKVWGDGAVTGGIVTLAGVDEGKRFRTRLRFADVWARRAGGWQVIFTQAGIAPAPPEPARPEPAPPESAPPSAPR